VIKITSKSFAQKFELKWSLGGPLSKLCVTAPFSINFRCQIENQVSDYRLLGASSLGYLFIFTDIYFFCYQILTTMNKFKMVPEVVLLLPNTDPHEQLQDGTRGCSTSVKYWPSWTTSRWYQRLFYFCQILATMNNFKMVPEVVLLLSNTDYHEQVQDGTRGCSTSVKYWPPWTSSRWYQRLFYFCQILTTMNKFKIIPEVVLLLSNTDHHEQVQYYSRDCFTATNPKTTKYVQGYVRY
jgi:hypothetical protein